MPTPHAIILRLLHQQVAHASLIQIVKKIISLDAIEISNCTNQNSDLNKVFQQLSKFILRLQLIFFNFGAEIRPSSMLLFCRERERERGVHCIDVNP